MLIVEHRDRFTSFSVGRMAPSPAVCVLRIVIFHAVETIDDLVWSAPRWSRHWAPPIQASGRVSQGGHAGRDRTSEDLR